MAKFTVTVMESGSDKDPRDTWHYFTGRSLEEAWRIVHKHVRRGRNRFGGTITYSNWGGRGGNFPHQYRSATIRMEG